MWIVNIHHKVEACACRLYRVTMQNVGQTLSRKRGKNQRNHEFLVQKLLKYNNLIGKSLLSVQGVVFNQITQYKWQNNGFWFFYFHERFQLLSPTLKLKAYWMRPWQKPHKSGIGIGGRLGFALVQVILGRIPIWIPIPIPIQSRIRYQIHIDIGIPPRFYMIY